MKKLFFYLFAALPLIVFNSCSDDDDLPDVDFKLEVTDGVSVDGVLYVVRGESLVIDGITVVNNEKNKTAIITAATYYWDAFRLGTSAVAPYGFTISTTEQTPLGHHELAIECPVYAVDKSPAVANLFYNVEVVADEADIPEGNTPGTTSFGVESHLLAN